MSPATLQAAPVDACGIDFGTSNSTAGWSRPGHGALLTLEDGKPTLPSVIFFHAEDAHVSYGRAALADYLEGHEGRMMRTLKSLLGTSMMDGQTDVGGRALPFKDLLAQFFGELKRRGERAAGREFTQAVLGRPVHFVDDDVVADQRAQATLEEVATDTYLADLAMFTDLKSRMLMASVMGVECQHLATLRAVGALLDGGAPELIAIPTDIAKLPKAAGSVAFPASFEEPNLASPPEEGAVK